MNTSVAVYIVTYRRHAMLKRALRSVLSQTFESFRAVVVNDDPSDTAVAGIVREFNDPRLSLYLPEEKRGAACSFNLMFDDAKASFVSLLEDDNWWEPNFLGTMLELLKAHPHLDAACCNERLWKENADGTWIDTKETVWSNFGTIVHYNSIVDLCGSAKICNSATLYRRRQGKVLKTPDDIPVDVTEHFRERMLTSGLLLDSRAMTNYALTVKTARAKGGLWGQYQALLIGSVFAALRTKSERQCLAKMLWSDTAKPTSPRAITLVLCGLAITEAQELLISAPPISLMRASLTIVRHFSTFWQLLSAKRRLRPHFESLLDAPLTKILAGNYREHADEGRNFTYPGRET